MASQPVKKSIHKPKLDALFQAIQKGNWQAPIFQDEHLPQLTLSLFAAQKITQQQAATILERVQTFKDHKHYKTYPILDAKGDLSKEALTILFPSFQQGKKDPSKNFRELSQDQLNEFKLLVAALPKSEQCFYLTDADKYEAEVKFVLALLHQDQKATQEDEERTASLGLDLIDRESMIYSKVGFRRKNRIKSFPVIINLSAGARDALGIVRFGVQNYVKMVPTFGEKTREEIEAGVRQKKRFGALAFPGTTPYTNIHDYEDVTNLEATNHDIYHSNLMSLYPVEMQQGFLDLASIIREITHFPSPWSKEIWHLIDAEFLIFLNYNQRLDNEKFRKNILSIKEMTRWFFMMIHSTEVGLFPRKSGPEKFSNVNRWDDGREWEERYISPLGVVFLLDVYKNPEKWQNNKIDFKYLPEEYPVRKFYQEIKDLNQHIRNDQPKTQVFKVLLYQSLKNTSSGKRQFKALSKLISAHSDLIERELKFKKVLKKDQLPIDKLNTIYLSLGDLKMDIAPKKNQKMVDKVIETIAKEKVGNNQEDIDNFKKAILDLDYNEDEAVRYVHNKKDKAKSENETQFVARPSTWVWMKLNPVKSGLSLGFLILFYGMFQVWQQDKVNQKQKPLVASPEPAPLSAVEQKRKQDEIDSKDMLSETSAGSVVQKGMFNHNKSQKHAKTKAKNDPSFKRHRVVPWR